MRVVVASLVMLCGCRQLLGLDDLPGRDASIDARVVLDADPSKLSLTRVTPTVIVEGVGEASRPAVLVIHGMHIVPGATVEITVHGGTERPVQVDSSAIQVSRDGTMLAVPVAIEPTPDLAANELLRLDVTVMQPAGSDVVSQTLSTLPGDVPVLEIAGLDELTGSNVMLPPGTHEYSRVDVSGLTSVPGGNAPVIVRSMSTVTIAGTVSVNAIGQTGGPGGGNGGAGGTSLGGMGQPGIGPGAGLPSGGGGSYATKGGGSSPAPVGSASLPTLEVPNRGSGGGGGNGNGTPSPGGAGGGGGGTIEITANGMVLLGAVEARGGNGVDSAADDGGGGTGGTILLRSGISVGAASVDVPGGNGANPGGAGRIRIDAPTNVPAMTNPPFYRGPTFVRDTPLIVTQAQPTLGARGQPLVEFRYYFVNASGSELHGPFNATFGPTGMATFDLPEMLFEGLNTVCLLVDGGDLERPEARNCVDLAYLF